MSTLAHRLVDSVSYRMFMLMLICLFGIGGYMAYDSVGVVEDALRQDVPLSAAQFGALYSAYTIPGIFIPTVAGRWVDQHGLRTSSIAMLSVSMGGAVLVCVGAQMRSFSTLLVARFFFGVGTEAAYVARNNAALDYFSDGVASRYLGVALAFTVASGRLGTLLTFAASDAIVRNVAAGWYVAALWFGAASCALSLLAALLFAALDRWTERVIGYAVRQKPSPDALADTDQDEQLDSRLLDVESTDGAAPPSPLPAAVGRLPAPLRRLYGAMARTQIGRDTLSLDGSFWYTLAIVMLYYGIVFPMQSTATLLLTSRFGVPADQTWLFTSSVSLISMLVSPILGMFVDKWGQAVHMCTAGFVLLVVATGWLYLAWPPWPAFVMFGVAFSVEPAALWPCVPILAPSRLSGFAFGVLSSGINIALSVMYPLLGAVAGNNGGDLVAGIFLSFVGMALCVAWNRREVRHFDNRCNQPPATVQQ